MFENLLEQPRFIDTISRDISQGELPPSVLFSGPRYSGKMTAALEIMRVLNCRTKGAPWQCSCHSCQASRLLLQPHLLLLGKRAFYEDISASVELFRREDRDPARYMLIRSVRKLLRRFDPVLWEGEEKKITKGSKALQEINDFLVALEPGKDLLSPKELKSGLAFIEKNVPDLEKLIPPTVPINQIRRISNWSHRASGGVDQVKIVVMERAETMLEGSRNALLKLLEEPPENLYLIMLTERKRMIMPTILSRVRNYSFTGRGARVSREVVNRLYRQETQIHSLDDWFGQYRHSGEVQLAELAESFLRDLCSRERVFPSRIFEGMEPGDLINFYEELFRVLRLWQRMALKGNGGVPLSVMEKWNRILREGYRGVETMNQNTLLMLESSYYRMREV
jgi:DNA polymerase III subunit gamma/tau